MLFVLLTVPAMMILITSPFCEDLYGAGTGTCTPPFLGGIYNNVGSVLDSFFYGSFILWAPILLIALVTSIGIKIHMFANGYRWNTSASILRLFVSTLPLIPVGYLVFILVSY